jgi:hypothetical protein
MLVEVAAFVEEPMSGSGQAGRPPSQATALRRLPGLVLEVESERIVL